MRYTFFCKIVAHGPLLRTNRVKVGLSEYKRLYDENPIPHILQSVKKASEILFHQARYVLREIPLNMDMISTGLVKLPPEGENDALLLNLLEKTREDLESDTAHHELMQEIYKPDVILRALRIWAYNQALRTLLGIPQIIDDLLEKKDNFFFLEVNAELRKIQAIIVAYEEQLDLIFNLNPTIDVEGLRQSDMKETIKASLQHFSNKISKSITDIVQQSKSAIKIIRAEIDLKYSLESIGSCFLGIVEEKKSDEAFLRSYNNFCLGVRELFEYEDGFFQNEVLTFTVYAQILAFAVKEYQEFFKSVQETKLRPLELRSERAKSLANMAQRTREHSEFVQDQRDFGAFAFKAVEQVMNRKLALLLNGPQAETIKDRWRAAYKIRKRKNRFKGESDFYKPLINAINTILLAVYNQGLCPVHNSFQDFHPKMEEIQSEPNILMKVFKLLDALFGDFQILSESLIQVGAMSHQYGPQNSSEALKRVNAIINHFVTDMNKERPPGSNNLRFQDLSGLTITTVQFMTRTLLFLRDYLEKFLDKWPEFKAHPEIGIIVTYFKSIQAYLERSMLEVNKQLRDA